MLELNRNSLEDILLGLDKRGGRAYFYRISGYNEKIKNFVSQYSNAARTKGVIVAGKLSNPDEKQIDYLFNIVGSAFAFDKIIIGKAVGRWIPQLDNTKCVMLTSAIYNSLVRFKSLGKNDAMIKNFYIKIMCWIYYKFSNAVLHIGENEPPKILYGGEIGRHELLFLQMLHECKCDIVFLQYAGEKEYNSLDPKGEISQKITLPQMEAFPPDFDLKKAERERELSKKRTSMYAEPAVQPATNVWMSGRDILEDVKQTPGTRGTDKSKFYNAYCRLTGVPDKVMYKNDLFRFYTDIKNSGRRYVIVENRIPTPTNDELMFIDRNSYSTKEQLVGAMLKCVKIQQYTELRRIVAKAFVEILLEEADKEGMNPQRLTTMTACVVCWINRYIPLLLHNWTLGIIPVFIYLGGCRSGHEAAFLRILSRIPCDVLILAPNLNERCILQDDLLFELKYPDSLVVTEFPTEMNGIQMETAAYHAEQEINSVLYDDTGMFRDYQYEKANSVILKTMYEEIDMLWTQETKFRPNFSVVDGVVNVPVLCAKISGVKDSAPAKYWKFVQSMLTDNTLIISSVPYLMPTMQNPMKTNSTVFLRNGKLNREAVLSRREYAYHHLRRETQNYIFDKIDLLINSRIIRGTFENGTEYLIAATLLYMPPAGFDFTKVNPKVVYINTGEQYISQEDAILTAFLSLVGFDVLFFVPTGYQTVELYFNKNILAEHKIGEYMYDLQVPKLKIPKVSKTAPAQKNKSLFGNLFRKGS